VRIIALDPGGTTGYAIALVDDPRSFGFCYGQRKLDESALDKLLVEVTPDYIVCEDFEYRNRARPGLDLTPARLIGVVKLYAQQMTCELTFQKAELVKGKGHYTDNKLKAMNIYERGKPHGRDAVKHLLHWLTFKKGFELFGEVEPMLHLQEEFLILDAIAEGNG
jgi:hypothetical protein